MRPIVIVATVLLVGALPSRAADESDIYDAAALGDLPLLIKLLDADPELVHARTAAGETPLHYAAARQRAAVVELLLSRGAEANAVDDRGLTPLHLVATSSDSKLITAVLAGGADVNAQDRLGETPLHVAARRLNEQAMRALLAAGADVNAQNRRGQTALHVLGAAARTPEQIARLYHPLATLLIEGGADPDLRDQNNIPALHEPRDDAPGPRGGYRTYEEIGDLMNGWAKDYPEICELHDLGLSVQGRHIWDLRITDSLELEEDEPEFKYVSTMHGDEWVGNEMCLFFIEHLLANYGTDPRITNLINEIDIRIVPLMNPDGYVLCRRENYNWVDLNRNFPEGTRGDPNTTEGREPETAVIMEWTFANSFTLSANFHTGALVVNYPYDNDRLGSVYSPTPDDDLFIWISEEYSQHNLPMWSSPVFYHGITNGAAWYSISGGMQDWHYRYMGDNEVTIELSNTKRPPYYQIPQYWEDNRESMLAYMETCLIGVRGIVTDADSGTALSATVTVAGREHEIYTDPDVGDYHRMLLPGTYDLRFEADGYDPLLVRDVVVSSGPATRLDVGLGRPAQVVSPNGGETLYVGVPTTVTWTGDPAAQFHVQYTDDYGDMQTISDGFESGGLDPGYETGGDADWFVTSSSAHSGIWSARAGDIGNYDESWLTRTVAGGELSFWYRVSSEEGYDYFNFHIDGEVVLHVSGFVGWTLYSTTLPAGNHALKWQYVKDGSGSHGSDTAWVDDLEFTEDHTVWTDIVALTDPGEMSTEWTPAAPGSDYKVRVRAYYDNSVYGWWDESDDTFEVVEGTPPGDLNGDGCVDQADLGILLADWGCTGGDCPGDCDGDGDTDQSDLGILLAHWGEGCG